MGAIVAVLAGGQGRRIGGQKACVQLAGRPLVEYPLAAARAAGLDTVVIAKASTLLPPMQAPVLLESESLPQHPLSGIVTGLERHAALVAVPCDMPFLTPELLLALSQAGGALVLAAAMSPFPALYTAPLIDELRRALAAETSVRSVMAASRATTLTGFDASLLFSVNSPADLELAERRLSG